MNWNSEPLMKRAVDNCLRFSKILNADLDRWSKCYDVKQITFKGLKPRMIRISLVGSF